jgi:O-antigen/teichoic acid export membrane protein
MLDKLKRTVKHSAIFALGKVGSKLVGFILLPIYTKEIAVADYGVLGVLEMVDLLGVHLLSFALQSALFRWYTLADNEIQKKSCVFSIFSFLTAVSLLSFLIFIPGRFFISQVLFEDTVYGKYFIYILLSISFQILSKIPLTLLRLEEKSVYYAVTITVQFTINLVLNIYFVAFLKWGVEGILIATAISNSIILVMLIPYSLKHMHFRLEAAELKEMISYSYPIMFAAIAATVLSLGDRFLLTKLSTLSMAGLYTLGYKFSNIIKLFVVDSFLLGLPIIGWQVVKENNRPKRFFSKTLTYFVFLLLWLGLFLSAYAKGIIHRFALNQSYWDAYLVVPYLALGIVLMGIQRVFFFELEIPKKTRSIPIIVGATALFNITLNLILIPRFDMMGAAYANILSNLGAVIAAYYAVQKYYPVKYEIKRLLVLFVTALGLYLTTLLFDDFSLFGRLIYKGIIVLSFPFVLYLIKFYEPIELDRIRGFVTKRFFKISKKS